MEIFRRRCMWKGVTAGLVGGLAGAWVMTRFQNGWSKASEILHSNNGNSSAQNQSQEESGSEDATMKAANKISMAVAGKSLSKDQKKSAGPIVHYAFGTAMGGLYGAAVEYKRKARYGRGLPFGAILFAGADEIAVPALGLSKSPTESPLPTHLYGLASHAVYGVTTESVRRLVRSMLRVL